MAIDRRTALKLGLGAVPLLVAPAAAAVVRLTVHEQVRSESPRFYDERIAIPVELT